MAAYFYAEFTEVTALCYELYGRFLKLHLTMNYGCIGEITISIGRLRQHNEM